MPNKNAAAGCLERKLRADGNEMAIEIEFDAYFLCFPLVALIWITVN